MNATKPTQADHARERSTGEYSGPEGRFWRIVDPANPTLYYGWSSDRDVADRFVAKCPDIPDGAVVQAAPRLTQYEATKMDLAADIPVRSYAEHQETQRHLLEERIPTIHHS